MRVLTVGNRYPPWSLGGYETTWEGIVGALRAAGCPTFVLTTLPDPGDRATDWPVPADVGRDLAWYWRDHAFPHRSLRQCVALERANAAVLAKRLRTWRPDVVLWWAMGGMSLSLLEQVRRAGLPSVAVVGDEWPAYGPLVDGWTRRWREGVGRRLAPTAERLVGVPARVDLEGITRWAFVSEHALTAARAAGLSLPSAVVHHPGVDVERLASTARPSWGWRLLVCGRIDPRKGAETALRSLAHLPREATLRIHGDGDARHAAELRRLAAGLGVDDRVCFTAGRHDEIAEVYRGCDALLFPVTWSEPWGLVPLEAMAARRPVVAANSGGGPAEYLKAEVNCLQFAAGDASGLAAAVRRLSDDEALRGALVRGGAATAARHSERDFHYAVLADLEAAAAAAAGAAAAVGVDR